MSLATSAYLAILSGGGDSGDSGDSVTVSRNVTTTLLSTTRIFSYSGDICRSIQVTRGQGRNFQHFIHFNFCQIS